MLGCNAVHGKKKWAYRKSGENATSYLVPGYSDIFHYIYKIGVLLWHLLLSVYLAHTRFREKNARYQVQSRPDTDYEVLEV